MTRNYSQDPADLLGSAKLSWENTTVVAEITLRGDLTRDQVGDLYPAAEGIYTGKNTRVSMGCEITGMALCPSKNTDHRIETVQAQLKEATNESSERTGS